MVLASLGLARNNQDCRIKTSQAATLAGVTPLASIPSALPAAVRGRGERGRGREREREEWGRGGVI